MSTEKIRNYDAYEDIDNKEEPILHSLIEDDNFIVLEKTIIRTLQLTKYLDNGKCNSFYADTEVTLVTEVDSEGKVTKESIEEIKVDGKTLEQITKEQMGNIHNCICKTIFERCYESLDEKEISLLKKVMRAMGLTTDDLECGDCETLSMLEQWMQQIEFG